MRLVNFLPFVALQVAHVAAAATPSVITQTFGTKPAPGLSQMSTSSFTSPFDGPKFPKTGINATSFDWWYFDAVSKSNPKLNMVVQFLTTNPSTLGLNGIDGQFFNWMLLTGTYNNGTSFEELVPAGNAVVKSSWNEGWSSGEWQVANCSWSGKRKNNGMYTYEVKVNSPAVGIRGTMKIDSLTKPHYPHALAEGKNEITEILRPNFGWTNAIPSGHADIDFTVHGERLSFEGWGYHDKNWGDKPTPQQAYSWYWGHAQLSARSSPDSLSLVWFDYISKDYPNPSSRYHNPTTVYLVQQNTIGSKVISMEKCKVRPFGRGVKYPPTHPAKYPEGFHIEVDAGKEGRYDFTATVKANATYNMGNFYSRFIGTVEGGKVGSNGKVADKDLRRGTGLWEWMYFMK